jgi:hypothetical protein
VACSLPPADEVLRITCTLPPAASISVLAHCPLQEAIRELQLCTTVDNEELEKAGVRLELDERSGKLKVSKRDE